MKKHEFYARYANTPLADRAVTRGVQMSGGIGSATLSLNEIYKRVKAIDDKIRNDEIEREQLLDEAAWLFHKLNDKSGTAN